MKPAAITATASTLRRLAAALENSGERDFAGTIEINLHDVTSHVVRSAVAQMMDDPRQTTSGNTSWVESLEPGNVSVCYFLPKAEAPHA